MYKSQAKKYLDFENRNNLSAVPAKAGPQSRG